MKINKQKKTQTPQTNKKNTQAKMSKSPKGPNFNYTPGPLLETTENG